MNAEVIQFAQEGFAKGSAAFLQAAQTAHEKVYVNPTPRLGMQGLDAVMAVSTLLCVVHALFNGKVFQSLTIIKLIAVLAVLVEQTSIQMGATHCHTDGMLMVSKCSSVNSVLFYIPWLYTSLFTSNKLYPDSEMARAASTGLLTFLIGFCYEVQGPALDWWQYGDDEVAAGAFRERVFGFPLMAAYFHLAFGAAFSLALDLCGASFAQNHPKRSPVSILIGQIFAMVLVPLFALAFDLPVRYLVSQGVTRAAALPCLSLLFFVAPLLTVSSESRPASSPLMFLFVFAWHAYFVSCKFWEEKGSALSMDAFTIAVALSLASLMVHASAHLSFGSGGEPVKGKESQPKKKED